MSEKMYMNVHTGSVDTRDNWLLSYTEEELEDRWLTAEEAWEEDEGTHLLEVTRINGEWIEV